MASLLKFYNPLTLTRFTPVSLSQAFLRRTLRNSHFSFFNSATTFARFTSSPTSSQLPVSAPNLKEINALRHDSTSSELWLHNTMSRKKEVFKPKVEGKVGMYVCGVTAYDLSHIGHARVYVTFDVLYRYLRHLGYEVLYVRNFTDVDDKIIARANELGEDPLNLSRRYCEEFRRDMMYLHCLPPSVEPQVSDHMPQIIDMIKQILDNGYAYSVDGDVYFNVDKFPEYGQLSGRKLEDNRAGERVSVDSRKKNPADFALWKSAKEGEPFWESPWGPGRPGWHIECSAMSASYLGYSFDIHGGGMDLVFPHHENEIAQSCAACRTSNVSYWVHNGFVTIDSEKMSKSLGNFFTIRQVIDLYHPLALRLFLLGTHYRSPINYSDLLLESASDRIFYIYQTLDDCRTVISQEDESSFKGPIAPSLVEEINKFSNVFLTSMSDDIHTPVVLAALSDPLKIINDLLHTRKALQQLKEKALTRAKMTNDQVLQKIEERNAARKNKEYEKSDSIRTDLAAVGISLMDGPNGTTWRPTVPLALQEHQASST
ncbi:cysteine--tRNA ligase, chloroplastic/mitochondrial isoform X2 [Cucumis sativus]|uniref:cysteine--tRNA ligase, chloroplastic/mitochondrial isoform X2 n=1 Tax=Cucumis sativus TaxID=3659 RepID=UPI0012F51A52|nr:cysteine--tRNA ligase, chloroplastic/mitochondrial isoform X2 [Cucumis sativus]